MSGIRPLCRGDSHGLHARVLGNLFHSQISLGLRHLKRSPLHIVSVMALGVVFPLDAGAWGFGRAQTSAVLGVPLDFNVALRLEPGEAPPDCLSVDVTVGDIPLPRSAVSAVLDTSAATPLVRVRTSQAIDEPLVQVNLSAGCTSRLSRRFTLLADPPGHLAAPALANAETLAAAAPTVPAPAAAPAAAAAMPAAASAPGGRTTAMAGAPGGAVPDAAGRAGTVAPVAGAAGTSTAASKAGSSDAAQKQAPAPRRRTADPGQLADAQAATPERQAPAATARPRLQLDAPTIATKAAGSGPEAAKSAAVLAAEQAASAARAAASAAEARAAAMEKNIEALRQEAKANRESLARLTQALQEAQSGTETPVAMWGALAGLGAFSALLMWRLRRQKSESGQEAPWWSPGSSASAEASATPEDTTGASAVTQAPLFEGSLEAPRVAAPAPFDPVSSGAVRSDSGKTPAVTARAFGLGGGSSASLGLNATPGARELPPLPDPEELDSPVGAMERTQLLPPSVSSVSAPIQGVSIEELLDLEQQVEFFTVLGQDDAALSLLVEHLRSTGGTYPLPYLKLLEIYRRKGDEDSYERTRDRFNQRFNAVVPAWGAPAAFDRHLEDLPEVLRRIEQVWPRPVDAMALLENMLVRTEGGTLLEMSALGEVLFLFTLARDLHEQEEGAAGPVDVLLPLDDLFDAPPVQASAAASGPPTQFSASSFDKLGSAAAVAGLAGLGVAATSTASSAGGDEDHFDLPLGEPMFEPVFDAPASAIEAASTPVASASIDLPLFPTSAGVGPENGDYSAGGYGSSSANADAPPLGLDLSFGDDPSANAPGSAPAADPFLEPLSFDLPELEAIQAPLPSKAETGGAVDLDISLDGLELEPVAPKLSPQEEQAASNFGLFIDSPGTGKPR